MYLRISAFLVSAPKFAVPFRKQANMTMPISTAMDSLSAALKSNIIPNQEYLLQGSVLDSAVEVLLHRLRGLCDNVDSGPETFNDHEMCFSIRRYYGYFFLYSFFFITWININLQVFYKSFINIDMLFYKILTVLKLK